MSNKSKTESGCPKSESKCKPSLTPSKCEQETTKKSSGGIIQYIISFFSSPKQIEVEEPVITEKKCLQKIRSELDAYYSVTDTKKSKSVCKIPNTKTSKSSCKIPNTKTSKTSCKDAPCDEKDSNILKPATCSNYSDNTKLNQDTTNFKLKMDHEFEQCRCDDPPFDCEQALANSEEEEYYQSKLQQQQQRQQQQQLPPQQQQQQQPQQQQNQQQQEHQHYPQQQYPEQQYQQQQYQQQQHQQQQQHPQQQQPQQQYQQQQHPHQQYQQQQHQQQQHPQQQHPQQQYQQQQYSQQQYQQHSNAKYDQKTSQPVFESNKNANLNEASLEHNFVKVESDKKCLKKVKDNQIRMYAMSDKERRDITIIRPDKLKHPKSSSLTITQGSSLSKTCMRKVISKINEDFKKDEDKLQAKLVKNASVPPKEKPDVTGSDHSPADKKKTVSDKEKNQEPLSADKKLDQVASSADKKSSKQSLNADKKSSGQVPSSIDNKSSQVKSSAVKKESQISLSAAKKVGQVPSNADQTVDQVTASAVKDLEPASAGDENKLQKFDYVCKK